MRFQRKRVAIIGGILAVFVLAVGIFAGVVNKQNDASAVSSTANISNDGWTGYLNGWRTKKFKMTVSEPAINRKRAWCGDLAGVTPDGNFALKTITVNENSSEKEKNLFKAMYYGEAGSYSDVMIHQVIHSILNEDSIMSGSKLYKTATSSSLPNKNNMTIYYTDPNNWGLSNHGRQSIYWQRIFTYSYEDVPDEMSLTIKKLWNDELDGGFTYPEIKVRVTRADGSPVLNADGSENNKLKSEISLTQANSFRVSFSGLKAGQRFKVTELMVDSGFEETDPGDGSAVWKHESIKTGDRYIYYVKGQEEGKCDTANDNLSGYCTLKNKQYKYTGIRLFLTKVWESENDEIENDEIERPENVYFNVKVFAGDEDITSVYQNGKFAITNWVIPGNSDDRWSGYISNLSSTYEIDGVQRDVRFYVAEVNDAFIENADKAFSYICNTETKIIGDRKYCLATSTGDSGTDLEGTITNKTEYVKLTVKKTWNDGRGAIYARPKVLFYDIYRNGEKYNETGIWNPCYFGDTEGCNKDQWSLEVSLPKYYKTANGTYAEAVYTVQETDYDWDGIGQGGLSQKYVIESNGLVMKNTAKTNIPVMKCWVDKDETHRPDSLTFNLYREGETEIQGTLVLTADDEDENGCWVGSFDNLLAYDKDTGEAITYTVEEDISEVDNYEAEEFGVCTVDIAERAAAKGKDEDIDTSCSFTNVELIDIPVVKVWEEDKKEDRPGSIEVSLLCGDDVLDTVTLSEANNLDGDNTWEYTWKNRRVDECEQGYSVAENINIPGYATKITGNAEDGFVITNTKTLDEIMTWGSLGAGSFGVIAAGFFVVKRKLFARY